MNGRIIAEIPYAEITLEEAGFILERHDGDGCFDADKQAVILTE